MRAVCNKSNTVHMCEISRNRFVPARTHPSQNSPWSMVSGRVTGVNVHHDISIRSFPCLLKEKHTATRSKKYVFFMTRLLEFYKHK